MPKKTLALITGLVLVTVILLVIALRTSKQQVQEAVVPQQVMVPTPTSYAHSVLNLAPDPITVAPGGTGTVSVNINTADNDVTAVQLELAYDPTVISNIQITPGPLFQNPVVLINKNNPANGRYTYAFGITPNESTIKGIGAVATITFTAGYVPGKISQLALLPSTLVTAQGVALSVLKSETGTLVRIGTAGTNAAPNIPLGSGGYTHPNVVAPNVVRSTPKAP
jgi:hypothetical protein